MWLVSYFWLDIFLSGLLLGPAGGPGVLVAAVPGVAAAGDLMGLADDLGALDAAVPGEVAADSQSLLAAPVTPVDS